MRDGGPEVHLHDRHNRIKLWSLTLTRLEDFDIDKQINKCLSQNIDKWEVHYENHEKPQQQ